MLNVTPDSFSDGGRYLDVAPAVARAERMVREGARVIDVGGESSRPKSAAYGEGASVVPVEEELRRVVPVIEKLVARGIPVSIDTVKPKVALAAAEAGARILNDVSGGASEALIRVAAERGMEMVLMHTRDRGQRDEERCAYEDVVQDVLKELMEAVARAASLGLPRSRIWLDPGVGFAKTASQSAQLLSGLEVFVQTGHPLLVGASRKSFIAELCEGPGGERPLPEERLGGSLAAALRAASAGARAVRVHDVAATHQALKIARLVGGRREAGA